MFKEWTAKFIRNRIFHHAAFYLSIGLEVKMTSHKGSVTAIIYDGWVIAIPYG